MEPISQRHSMRFSNVHSTVLNELAKHGDQIRNDSQELFGPGSGVDLFVRSHPDSTGTVDIVAPQRPPLYFASGFIQSLMREVMQGKFNNSSPGIDN
jgi:hypothetical protein